ncbi:MAG: hypothetical protein HY014_05370 [Acidobacteria bacterium]|nr:hypothetical protein [Acidobacteriota bacterium]MBI3487582.1 hypothetical protein [Acidobacteriota bacterium]
MQTLIPTHQLTPDQALAGMLVGNLLTIPQLCQTSERWCITEDCFWDNGSVVDSFLFMGLPTHVLEFGGCQHVLINPKEFDDFMESICSEESA